MLAGIDHLRDITTYLNLLSMQVEQENRLNLTDLNVAAEDFYCGLLNRVFDADFINLNDSDQNATAIDLGDKSSRRAIQVTSTAALSKIRESLEKFVAGGLGEDYDRLIVLNIVRKSRHRAPTVACGSYILDTKKDVWDNGDLIREIKSLPSPKKQEIFEYLRREFKPPAAAPAVSTEVATVLTLIEYISDPGHPAAGLGFSDEPDPDKKINERFSDHATYLKDRFAELYPEYASVLEAVKDHADIGPVRHRRAADFLRDYSDSVLKRCSGDPKVALETVVQELTDLLAKRGHEYSAGAVTFYVLDELTRCNVFPNERGVYVGSAFEG